MWYRDRRADPTLPIFQTAAQSFPGVLLAYLNLFNLYYIRFQIMRSSDSEGVDIVGCSDDYSSHLCDLE